MKKIFIKTFIIVTLLIFTFISFGFTPVDVRMPAETQQVNEAFEDVSHYNLVRGGYDIEDIRRMVGQQTIYQNKRVHTIENGVRSYNIPLEVSEINQILQSADNVSPLRSFTYNRQRIHGGGRNVSNSIVSANG